ncbi:tetratricopeptide repeat protein [Nonomuraea sp. NBC_01738]|uniref:AfsR/SARP family transcriptional regulator n=1 Tax=Nonomuraea sp. NBC_01738 TaxID=2976003 RepID=UPI002E0F67E2|nr:tetratricopeptide repeat protein [Nonomuraea sp. NBC_01738]
MDFRVLGPLEVAVDRQRLDLGGTRQQIALALLLLDVNHVVTIGRLMEAIYGEDPPTTSRSQVQICISTLRRLLAAHGEGSIISTEPQGYALRVAREQVDANRFDAITQNARAHRDTGDPDNAVKSYREALALWRGPALDGIDSRLVQSAANRLTENRATVYEDCIQLEVELGRHREVIGELSELVEEHPLRERLRGQLMLALYRSGRQAEALQVYRRARQALIEELGIEPNEELQRLEYKILTSDESLNAPAQAAAVVPEQPHHHQHAMPVPGLLPTDIADFTGRTKQVDEIRQQFELAARDPSRLAVPIIVLVGKPGIGKSAIAVHASHTIADHYADGQLYADMHGASSRPTSPMQVLERFLRALGVPGTSIPEGLEERAEMYRGLLADRRMLVVMDDVMSETQVQPLVPGNPGCAVLITSRSRLGALAGAIHVEVDVFDSNQSMELLTRIAGVERVQSEPEASAALADLCGQLPLALRIAGARLSARPHWSVEQLVGRLEDETRRLDELKHGDMGIRASISLTYESVGEGARRLFKRLAILDSKLFSGWISAALMDQPLTDAQDLLDELADAQLVETTGSGSGFRSQYRFHDLIRVFARERLAVEESAADRNHALARVLGGLLYLSQEAHRREYGGEYVQIKSAAPRWKLPERMVERLVASPLAWYERERHTLVSGIRQAAQAGFTELCWELAISSVTLFEVRVYLDDWRETHEIALEAARAAKDVRGHAAMLYSLGSLHITEQRFEDARRHFDAAVPLFEQAGDDQGLALVVRNIAFLDRMSGRYAEAEANYTRALASFRKFDDPIASAYVLHNLAHLRLEHNDPEGAERMLAEALELSRTAGGRRVEAQVLHRMGETHLHAGQPGKAAEAFGAALPIVQDTGDPTGEAYVLHGLGMARLQMGEAAEAEGVLRRSFMLASTAGDKSAEARAAVALGELDLSRGRALSAIGHLRHALEVFRGIDTPIQVVRVMVTLGEAYHLTGDAATVRELVAEAAALIERVDPPLAGEVRQRLVERLRRLGGW